MNMDQIVGLIGLLLGVLLYLLAGDSEAYFFPRVIATMVAILGLALLVSNIKSRINSTPISKQFTTAWFRIIPVIAMFIAYPWAIEWIGFYSAGFMVFLAIVCRYAPGPFSMGVAVRRITITALFFTVVFVIFSVALDVQTPRGILF